jgi:CHAT domain-containing protein
MVAFAERLRDGVEPAAALRGARAAVRTRYPRTFATPWTWAGFVVIGGGRERPDDGSVVGP